MTTSIPFSPYAVDCCWKTYLIKNNRGCPTLVSERRGRISFQLVVKLACSRFLAKLSQISVEYLQEKNRWCFVSTELSQNIHVVIAPSFQRDIRSPVDKRLCITNHAYRENFGVEWENQIPLCQSSVGAAFRIRFQVCFELKACLYPSSLKRHLWISAAAKNLDFCLSIFRRLINACCPIVYSNSNWFQQWHLLLSFA